MENSSFSLPSFAKINWRLQVLGKRSDGYHEVRTFLQSISLHDELRFESCESDTIRLTCDDPTIPTDETNLIVRAANVLRERCGLQSGAALHLRKLIPARGGLGGGSSNAAVALLGLARLWRLDISNSDLTKIGSTLGADVPFFFMGGCALGTGMGSTLSPFPDSPRKYLLIISPKVSVSTDEAYKALNASALTRNGPKSILAVSHEELNFSDSDPWPISEKLVNDFEEVIFDKEPEIGRAKTALLSAGAQSALLAGSGSSVFGIFDDQNAQQIALKKIQLEIGWRIFPCVTMSRNEYFSAMSSPESLRSF